MSPPMECFIASSREGFHVNDREGRTDASGLGLVGSGRTGHEDGNEGEPSGDGTGILTFRNSSGDVESWTQAKTQAGAYFLHAVLTSGTWSTTLSTSDKTAIINALSVDADQANGAEDHVLPSISTSDVTRVSDTEVKIEIAQAASLSLTADQGILFSGAGAAIDGKSSATLTGETIWQTSDPRWLAAGWMRYVVSGPTATSQAVQFRLFKTPTTDPGNAIAWTGSNWSTLAGIMDAAGRNNINYPSPQAAFTTAGWAGFSGVPEVQLPAGYAGRLLVEQRFSGSSPAAEAAFIPWSGAEAQFVIGPGGSFGTLDLDKLIYSGSSLASTSTSFFIGWYTHTP